MFPGKNLLNQVLYTISQQSCPCPVLECLSNKYQFKISISFKIFFGMYPWKKNKHKKLLVANYGMFLQQRCHLVSRSMFVCGFASHAQISRVCEHVGLSYFDTFQAFSLLILFLIRLFLHLIEYICSRF